MLSVSVSFLLVCEVPAGSSGWQAAADHQQCLRLRVLVQFLESSSPFRVAEHTQLLQYSHGTVLMVHVFFTMFNDAILVFTSIFAYSVFLRWLLTTNVHAARGPATRHKAHILARHEQSPPWWSAGPCWPGTEEQTVLGLCQRRSHPRGVVGRPPQLPVASP